MNKWLLLILGIISILLLSYISFKQKASLIQEDILKRANILHENSAFKDVYIKLKGEGIGLTREVVLLGKVSSKEEISLASKIVEDIEGVTKVNNLLKVQTSKTIIKEVKSIEDEPHLKSKKTIKEKREEKKIDDKNISSVDSNITLVDKNISKKYSSEDNITDINKTKEINDTELNSTKIELLDTNLTVDSNETNQSICQNRLNSILSKRKIHFAYNSSNIEKSSYKELEEISTILKECAVKTIEINGYTDNRGDPSYNKYLSQLRANRVKAYLISKGIDKNSIKAFGHGAKNPIASNKTKEGREKNRRIEFIIK